MKHTRFDPITELMEAACNRDRDRIMGRPSVALPKTSMPDPDSTQAQLAACVADLVSAIEHLKAACRDPRVDESLGEFTLDALRGVRDQVEEEAASGRAR